MPDTYLDPGGIIVPTSALQIPRARALAAILDSRRLNYVAPVEYRSLTTADGGPSTETVVFDLEVERPQHLQHDIRRFERIAVRFTVADNWYPEVLALRPDFPSVPHLNLRATEFPRSLCLYDQAWDQVALHWTPTACVERIRTWLAETAKGTLHQDDQPLEPLMFGSGYRIILPADLFENPGAKDHEPLNVLLAGGREDSQLLFAFRQVPGQKPHKLEFLAYPIVANPQTGGAIRRTPDNLKELHAFLLPCGVNLADTLRDKVRAWYDQEQLKQKKLILIVAFPRVRDGGGQTIETTDIWVFLTTSTIQDVGVALGALAKVDNKVGYGQVVGAPDASADGHTVGIDVLSPLFNITPSSAAAASGYRPDERQVLAVGVGALGSQVVDLLARSGFGTWTLIDEDLLLPHNLARHALRSAGLGFPKAEVLAYELDQYFASDEKTKWIKADVLHPGVAEKDVAEALNSADLILDFSASIPVERHLALEAQTAARRASLFLNPRGTDLVMLAEGKGRSITLDCLEVQYYCAIANRPELKPHLLPADGRIRYARSCRDVTAVIPNHLVTLLAGIGAKAVRQAAASDGATIRLWQCDPESLAVQAINIPTCGVERKQLGDWTLVLSTRVLDQLQQLRTQKLPNETGGVLVGDHDFERKTVYVVDLIPSPPDSEEWPTLYIRGSEGLFVRVQDIGRVTDGQLQYVGEWHSHPDNCSCKPSDDDLKVFTWLTENLGDEGKPALMAIVGQGGASAWFLGEMLRSGGWEPKPPAHSAKPSAKRAATKQRAKPRR